jgi:hypothetical protein
LPRIQRRHVTYGLNRPGRLLGARRSSSAASRRASTRTAAASPRRLHREDAGRAQRAQLPRDDRRRRRARGPARRHQASARDLRRRRAALHGGRHVRRASRWSTTTATTPPRSARRSRPRAARSPEDEHRIVVAFQPHRYTRTRTSSTTSREPSTRPTSCSHRHLRRRRGADPRDVTSERLVRSIRQHGHHNVTHVADKMVLHEAIARVVRRGDVVIALGAGDVNKMLHRLRAHLEALPEDKLPPRESTP